MVCARDGRNGAQRGDTRKYALGVVRMEAYLFHLPLVEWSFFRQDAAWNSNLTDVMYQGRVPYSRDQ